MAGTFTQVKCSNDALVYFSKNVGLRRPILRVNALMVLNSILMVVMVGIGAYGHRYRHHPVTRFLFLGATTLFLPIVSYVVSASGVDINGSTKILDYGSWLIQGNCDARIHIIFVLVLTGLVLIIGINTTAIVAADAREGRSIPPKTQLLVRATWISCLAVYTYIVLHGTLKGKGILLLLGPFGLIFAKLLISCYAWYTARKSFALRRNPRLIVGYMEQLQDGRRILQEQHAPPPLIVSGEYSVSVEKKPCGYYIRPMSNRDTTGDGMYNSGALVTLDKVWQFNDTHLMPKELHLTDLCFSFALFKLLRCRFARYIIAEAGFMKARNFLRHVLLEDNNDIRVFTVIAHELSFLHDYYYSSLSISYSKSWLPILNIFISLLSISYCLFATIPLMSAVIRGGISDRHIGQINCNVSCKSLSGENISDGGSQRSFGNVYFDIVPLCLIAALVVLAEVRDIASYICSNWTKVALTCHYVKYSARPQSPTMPRCVGRILLKCKSRLTKNWEDKMKQRSVLVLRRLIPLPGPKKMVPNAVKAAIVRALRKRINDAGVTSFQKNLHLQDGDKTLWEFDGAKGTAETMIVCHIATTILNVRSDYNQHLPNCENKIVANDLSRYCAYLVAHSPELLPEDDDWCKRLYKDVKKDAERVLVDGEFGAKASGQQFHVQLINKLGDKDNHKVLKEGAKLADKLVGQTEGEETAWKALADFWSDMILYVAPSDNMDGHAKAIARGGELITLIWALVTHLGVVAKPDDTAATTDAALIQLIHLDIGPGNFSPAHPVDHCEKNKTKGEVVAEVRCYVFFKTHQTSGVPVKREKLTQIAISHISEDLCHQLRWLGLNENDENHLVHRLGCD